MSKWIISTLFYLLLLSGCMIKKEDNVASFQIMTPQNANRGTPFYVVVKSTEMGEFYMDDYQKIANQMSFSSEKQEEFTKKILLPGTINKIKLNVSDKSKPMAIYFLFTHPLDEWKVFFDHPENKRYKILLGESGIESTVSY